MNPARILVVDDHPLVRLGIRRALEGVGDVVVAGELADLGSVRDWLAAGGRADVAILDLGLPDGDGLELVPRLKAAGMKILVLTIEDGDGDIRAAIDAGVDGYLLKSADVHQIGYAVGVVLNDAGAFPPQVMQKLYRPYGPDNPLARLSARELEVAEEVARGCSNKVIGARLHLSDNTVRNHLANIMQKLDFHNRVQVAALVLPRLGKGRPRNGRSAPR